MKIKKYKLIYNKSDRDFIHRNINCALNKGYLTDGGYYVEKFEKDLFRIRIYCKGAI